ncbi:MAG: substrate-binding and VWA domain-containing protein [Actinomycetia bacterium]|nr:substrate-binding and VWA domain-containing protein [Actinomycetes bacterium]
MVGLLLVIGAWFAFGGSSDSADGGGADGSGCTVLNVTASSEKAAILQDLATAYNDDGPQVNEQCVRVSVTSASSGGTAQALARGWDDTLDGTRPDVWSPASSSWPVLVRQWRADDDLPAIVPTSAESVVQTPLVIAMPRPMAETLGWPDKQIGWSDLADLAKNPKGWAAEGHPEWGRFKLGKTNPNFSTSGLNATIASYFAATGVSSDLTIKQVKAPATEKFVKNLESAVVHYGDTTLTFLDTMAREAAAGKGLTYVSAVTVEEKSVLDYNRGNPTGDPATAGQQPPPSVPLAAVYPSDGTLLSDNPWVVLDTDWVSEAKRAAAGDFLEYLRSDEQQEVFTNAGFRTFDGTPGDVLNLDNGLIPAGASNVLSPPAPPVLAQVLENWDELRKRARVLYVMDVSGSMGQPVPSAGQSKLALAQEAAINTLDGFAGNDEIGLWVFSTNLGPNQEPWSELVPVDFGKTTLPQMKDDIGQLVADGGTALYATLRVAQEEMVQALESDRINAIILLSDGKNEYPPDTDLTGLLEQLDSESLDTSVRVFTIGYGEAADTATLEAIAQASRGRHYDAGDPNTIGEVLTSVLSNF